ncbi:MAG: hypothetical protein IJO29_01100 [Oscillospiraceae bacterium]|nr:hypothetical protein [Oscillospiraceae bacterium]
MDLHIAESKNDVRYVLAKSIRVITVPPVMAAMLLVVLRNYVQGAVFKTYDFLFSMIFLAILPFLAYPVSYILPEIRCKGREGQRNLAFVLNAIGYTCAAVYGIIANVSDSLMLIFLTYFLSVIILSVFNKVLNIRASGHACSIFGPLVLLVYFMGIKFAVPCIIVFALICWASVQIGRHTFKELMLGAFSAAVAFVFSTFFASFAVFLRSIGILT